MKLQQGLSDRWIGQLSLWAYTATALKLSPLCLKQGEKAVETGIKLME